MSHFSFFAAEQREVSQVIVVFNVFERRSLVKTDIILRSGKNNPQYFSIIPLGVEVKWYIPNIKNLAFKGPQKFKVVAFELGDIMEDSDGNLLQKRGTVLNACKVELA